MSENLEAIRQICTDIAKRVDRAYMAEQGRKREPATKLMDLWAETGLLGIALPEEFGGIGGDMTDLASAIDWLGQDGLFPTPAPTRSRSAPRPSSRRTAPISSTGPSTTSRDSPTPPTASWSRGRNPMTPTTAQRASPCS